MCLTLAIRTQVPFESFNDVSGEYLRFTLERREKHGVTLYVGRKHIDGPPPFDACLLNGLAYVHVVVRFVVKYHGGVFGVSIRWLTRLCILDQLPCLPYGLILFHDGRRVRRVRVICDDHTTLTRRKSVRGGGHTGGVSMRGESHGTHRLIRVRERERVHMLPVVVRKRPQRRARMKAVVKNNRVKKDVRSTQGRQQQRCASSNRKRDLVPHTYFSQYSLVRHSIESFNHFIHTLLPHIIQESSEIRVQQENEEHVVTLCNVSVSRPTTTDADGKERTCFLMARLRGLTYASAVLVDVVHDIFDEDGVRKERRLFRETCLCRLPVMLGSLCCHTQHREDTMECRLDQGGYFIVGGCEKVVVAQEKLHHNTPYVFSVKQPSRYALQCEIRSCHERKLRSTSSLYINITNAKKGATPEMVATLPFVNMNVPVLALFRLLGVTTRNEAIDLIVGDEQAESRRLLSSILDNDSTADMNIDDLYEFIGRTGTRETTRERRQRYIDHIVNCEVLPHQGLVHTPEVLRGKSLYLGMMIRKLIRVYMGEMQCDDRDHYAAKRVDCAGTQFGLLFRQNYRTVHKSIAMQCIVPPKARSCTDVGDLVSAEIVASVFALATATGAFPSTRGNTAQNGVAQQLSRMTIPATLSLLRKCLHPSRGKRRTPSHDSCIRPRGG